MATGIDGSVQPTSSLDPILDLDLHQQIDKVYCLNLPTSKQRKKDMQAQFAKFDWKCEFVAGVHPKQKSFNQIIRSARKVDTSVKNSRCYCPMSCKHRPRKLRLTEIAISLSHLSIYKQATQQNQQWIMVCEDDVRFVENLGQIVNQTIPEDVWQSSEPTIIFLGNNKNPGLKITDPQAFSLHETPKGIFSNYCYLINLSAMDTMIHNFYPITRPEDAHKRFLIWQGKIKGYQIKPGLVAELSMGVNSQAKYRRLSRFHKLPTESLTKDGETRKNWKPTKSKPTKPKTKDKQTSQKAKTAKAKTTTKTKTVKTTKAKTKKKLTVKSKTLRVFSFR